jgi:acyl-CoA synthetase (AMP-forming)/AMP-acid ligase II
VSDVQVIGVPSEKYGEEVMAWVRLKPGASATGSELEAFCKGKIATYKIPRYVHPSRYLLLPLSARPAMHLLACGAPC